MAIDQSSIQMLGMILGNKSQELEASKNRGHEMNMMSIQNAQRNLETQLNQGFQEKMNVENQLRQTRQRMESMGVDVSDFGSDSQLGDMMETFGESLEGRAKALDALNAERVSQLEGMIDLESDFVAGVDYASGLNFALGADNRLDPNSEFGEFEAAIGNTDRMAELLESKGIELPADPSKRKAYISGMQNVLSDQSQELSAEQQRLAIIGQQSQNELARAQINAIGDDWVQKYSNRLALANQLGENAKKGMNPFLGLQGEEESDKEFSERVAESFAPIVENQGELTLRMADWLGIEVNEQGESTESASALLRQVQGSLVNQSQNQIMSLLSDPDKFNREMTASLEKLESAKQKHGDLKSAILAGDVPSDDLANVFAFVLNPNINSTPTAGFKQLDALINSSEAKNALMNQKNGTRAEEQLFEAINKNRFEQLGEEFSSTFTSQIIPKIPTGGGTSINNDILNVGNQNEEARSAEEIFSSEPELSEEPGEIEYNPNESFRDENFIDRTIKWFKDNKAKNVNRVEKQNAFSDLVSKLSNIKSQMDSGRLSDSEMIKAQFDYIRISKTLGEQKDIIERMENAPRGSSGRDARRILRFYRELTGIGNEPRKNSKPY